MIVVDASALCAICLNEAEGEAFQTLILANPDIAVSAVNLWEARVTIARRMPELSSMLEEIIDASAMIIAPVGERELELAWEAWRRFGKGRHPAALNMGDCFAYATAMQLGCALLFKGDDFSRTDVPSASSHPP